MKYIRYKDYQMFVSDDDWKSFQVLKKKAVSAVEEIDEDLRTEIKLRYELGEKRGKAIIEIFKSLRKEYHLKKSNGYGDSFEIFALATLFNLDYDVVIQKYIVKGDADGKIDGIYWDDQRVYLMQFKLGNIKKTDVDIMRNNHREFLRSKTITSPDSSDLLNYYEEHADELPMYLDSVPLVISDNYSDAFSCTPKEIFERFFKQELIKRNNNIRLVLNVPEAEYNMISLHSSGVEVYAYFDDAKNLIHSLLSCEQIFSQNNIDKLFYDNVRGDLGKNKNMQNTILTEPENFVKYNNGITITGDVEFHPNNLNMIITNPVISNGQQTIMNLLDAVKEDSIVKVLVIIKNDSSPKVKSKIARFTNDQRAIKPIDLLSLNQEVRDIQEVLYEETPYFLKIHSSGKKSYDRLVSKIYDSTEVIMLQEFLRLYFATEDLQLGSWKSSVSYMLREKSNEKFQFTKDKAEKVCKTLSQYKLYLNSITDKKIKNDLRVADLAIMVLCFKHDLDYDFAHKIIETYNNRNFYDLPKKEQKSKLIDLYKSNDIYGNLEELLEKTECCE